MGSNNRTIQSLEALQDFLPEEYFTQSTLLVEDYTNLLSGFFHDVHTWNTRYSPMIEAALQPPHAPYNVIIIRLPKSHTLFDFILKSISTCSHKQTNVIVYGMNDEGIKGAQKKLTTLFDEVHPLGYKNRCRVLHAKTRKDTQLPTQDLASYAQKAVLTFSDYSYTTTYFPGMFAQGELDPATEILLTNLPPMATPQKVLDFACGSGIIARHIAALHPHAHIDALDNDILSLEAAKINCGSVVEKYYLANSLSDCERYDWIISNPPMHTEKDEHTNIIEDLITTAPKHLTPQGKLIIVVQSRLKLDALFEKHFSEHHIITQNTRFTIWQGTCK